MSRARDALTTQADLQTLRERAYDLQVDFAIGHDPKGAPPGSHGACKAETRAAVYEAAGQVVAALDAALDAQSQAAALLRQYGAGV